MAEKMTKREKYVLLGNLKEVQENPILRELVANEIEILDRKKASRKTTDNATDVIIKGLVENALRFLDTPSTVTEILEVKEVSDFTYQVGTETKRLSASKVTSILKKMESDKIVVNTKDKKKSLYALAE